MISYHHHLNTITKFVVNVDPRCVQHKSWCYTGSISLYLQSIYKIVETALFRRRNSNLLLAQQEQWNVQQTHPQPAQPPQRPQLQL